MGRALLVARLAARNLRRRPVEAALLLLAIMATTTTLTLGLALQGVTDDPYDDTREATAGPDVVASTGPVTLEPNQVVAADLTGLEALADEREVADHGGPYPAVGAELDAGGDRAGVWAVGRDPGEASIDRPELTQGSWVEDGGVVVEAGLADTLGVGEGDQIALRTMTFRGTEGEARPLDRRSFRVVGIAVTAAARPYPDVCIEVCPAFPIAWGPDDPEPDGPIVDVDVPEPTSEPGLVWLTDADARSLAPADESLSYVMHLKLTDPGDAPAYAVAHRNTIKGGGIVESWQEIREAQRKIVQDQQVGLQTGSWLLAILAVASVAVLVGGRIADQTRRVGLLKAVGGTPRLVAFVLLAEYVVLALLAAAAGLAAGWLAAPLLTDPSAGLLGSAGAPSLTLSTVALVIAVALGVAVAATLVPSLRAATTSTVRALADTAHPPRRVRWLIALSARLPISLLLGLRVAGRRPRRIVLNAASIAITVSGIIAALGAHATIGADEARLGGVDPQADRLNQVLLVITVMLGGLAAVNAIFVTWATALDSRHSAALARALGATPRQVSTGLSAAQVLPALAGALLGIPGGLGLYTALSNEEAASPPLWQLLAVVPVTMLVVAALTAIPARLGSRRPTAEVLQSELV